MKSKSLKKSIFLSVLAMLMLASIAVGGTYAYFTDSVSIDNNVITAGDISITAALTHESGTGSVDSNGAIQIANFAPGDTAEYKLTVTNVGSLDASYKVMATSTDPSLATALIFKYTVGTGGTQEDMTFTDDVFQTAWADIASTDPDATVEMFIDITFNAGAGNNYQNTSFAFDINVLATQVGATTTGIVLASTVADITAATAGSTVVFVKDIVGDVSLTKAVNFDFNGHKLMGDLSITDNTASTIDIGDAGVDKGVEFITGDVNITAIAATVNFNVGANASKTITAATDNSSFHFNGGFVELDASNEVVAGSTEVGTITISAGRLVVNTPAKVVVAKKPTVAELGDANVTEDAQIKDVAVVVAENVTAPSVTVEDTVSEQVAIENSGTITEVENNSSVKVEVVGTAPESSEGNITVNGKITIANADTAWYDDNTAAESFEISTAEELLGVSKLVNKGNTFAGKTIELKADIDLSNAVWVPIGAGTRGDHDSAMPFGGSFDGGECTITGLNNNGYVPVEGSLDGTEYHFGLFGYVRDATIENVKLTDVSIDTNVDSYQGDSVGGIVGFVHRGVNINNCEVTDGTISGTDAVAAIAGRAYGEEPYDYSIIIQNCTVGTANTQLTIQAVKKSAGVLAMFGAQGGYTATGHPDPNADNLYVINNCTNYADISGEEGNPVGGIVGMSNSNGLVIKNCTNDGDISTTLCEAAGIGGILGHGSGTYGIVDNCTNNGYISGLTNVGGVVGYTKYDVTNSINNGGVTAIGSRAGGIVGSVQDEDLLTVENCQNTGSATVTAVSAAGGIIGGGSGTFSIINCNSRGSISAETQGELIVSTGMVSITEGDNKHDPKQNTVGAVGNGQKLTIVEGTVYGTTIFCGAGSGNVVIEDGGVWHISKNITYTSSVSVTVDNGGEIYLAEDCQYNNNGLLTNNGVINNYGTIINNESTGHYDGDIINNGDINNYGTITGTVTDNGTIINMD